MVNLERTETKRKSRALPGGESVLTSCRSVRRAFRQSTRIGHIFRFVPF